LSQARPQGWPNDARTAFGSHRLFLHLPLDAAPAWWPPELFGDWRFDTLREITMHVMTETACHTGHPDAARELIEGRQWLVLTE
jgi:hypothetical protein